LSTTARAALAASKWAVAMRIFRDLQIYASLEQKGSQLIAIRILWSLETSPRTPLYKPKDSTTSSSPGSRDEINIRQFYQNFIRH
jgi:hypothetical protein